MSPEAWISLALASVAAIVWLVRLESRINAEERSRTESAHQLRIDTARTEAEIAKTERDLRVDIAAVKARQDSDAATHSETTLALVRVQEQLKHLTGLVERLLTARPATSRAPRSTK